MDPSSQQRRVCPKAPSRPRGAGLHVVGPPESSRSSNEDSWCEEGNAEEGNGGGAALGSSEARRQWGPPTDQESTVSLVDGRLVDHRAGIRLIPLVTSRCKRSREHTSSFFPAFSPFCSHGPSSCLAHSLSDS